MSMPSEHPTQSAASRRWRGRARVAQAMALMTVTGAAQKVVPMSRWSRVIGEHSQVPTKWEATPDQTVPVRSADLDEERVRRAIRRASERLPWTPSCLAQAAAGQIMLRRRGKPGVVVIGLRPADGEWDAHAWLLGARGALTGGQAAEGFTPTTVFEVPDGLKASDVDLSEPTPHHA
jgi:hypothetical protein